MGKVTFALKLKTIKSIKIYAEEHNIGENKVVQKALDQFFEGDYEEFWDDLYQEGIKVAKQYDKISPSLLQRELQIGYARACRMMDQLEKDQIIRDQWY